MDPKSTQLRRSTQEDNSWWTARALSGLLIQPNGPQGRGYTHSTRRLGVGGRSFCADQAQVFAILAFRKLVDDPLQLPLIDEARPVGGFLEAGGFQSLPMLDRRDVITRLEQARLRAGVEPRHSAAEQSHVQLVALEVERVEVGDLQFVARRRS